MIENSDFIEADEEDLAGVVALVAGYYGTTYFDKELIYTSILTGSAWAAELVEGNPKRIFNNYRMSKLVLRRFCFVLKDAVTPTPWSRVEVEEQVAMFLYCLSKHASNRDLQERFQHSGETVHRHFYRVFDVVCDMTSKHLVVPDTPLQSFTMWHLAQ